MSRKSGYLGNPNLKDLGENISFTKEQVEEIIKCKNDMVYFVRHYMMIINLDRGLIRCDLYSYQERLLKVIQNSRFTLVKMSRQSGKTTTIAAYVLHYILFNSDVKVAILANKESTAKEILSRIKRAYELLPKWLQQGVKEWNKKSIELENGSKVVAAATSASSVRGDSFNCISGESEIVIRNTKTGEIVTTTMEALFHRANSSSNTTRYLDANDRQQIQEVVLFSDGQGFPENFTGHFRKPPHQPTLFWGNQRTRKYGKTDHTRTFVSAQTSSEVFARCGKSENGLCVFSDDSWTAGEMEFVESARNLFPAETVFRRSTTLANRNETFGRNKSQNRQQPSRNSYERINKIPLANDQQRQVSGDQIVSRKMQTDIGWIEGQEKITRSYQQDQSQSRENSKDGSGPPRNETVRRSKKTNEFGSKTTNCPDGWTTQQRSQNGEWEVYTSGGFKQFRGISRTNEQPTIRINTAKSSINCTPDHKIATKTGFVPAKSLRVGSLLKTDDGFQQVTEIWDSGCNSVYDLIQVADLNAFYANGIEVHNCVILDEFAFVSNTVAEDFFASTLPTISSGKTTKLVAISTPKGMNHFYKLWVDAVNKRNDYVPVEIHWSETPGRDAKWKEETIKMLPGGEREFTAEFECQFLGSVSTLINSAKLASLAFLPPIREFSEGGNAGLLQYADPVFDRQDPKKNHVYVMVVDVARGVSLDYSAFIVIDVTSMPFKIVARYRNNVIPPMLFPSVIHNVAKLYNDARVLVETKDIGQQVADILYQEMEYVNVIRVSNRKQGQVVDSGFGTQGRSQLGVMTTTGIKNTGCSTLKSMIEEDKLIVTDFDTITELSTFISKKKSFEAEEGANDDLVMCLVLFGWLTTQPFFKELTEENIRDSMYRQKMDMIDKEFGPLDFYMADGVADPYEHLSKEDRWF